MIGPTKQTKGCLSWRLRAPRQLLLLLVSLGTFAAMAIGNITRLTRRLQGSETTATLVCNTIYLLCSHSNVLQRLTEEIRSRFTSDCQITFSTARELSYLKAVLEESLRYTCPVPLTLARVVPTQGAVICGRFVPEGTVVGVNQVATNRSPKNFVEPETFKPERWMGDVEFAGDDRDACKPFSHGSRNCIGKKSEL